MMPACNSLITIRDAVSVSARRPVRRISRPAQQSGRSNHHPCVSGCVVIKRSSTTEESSAPVVPETTVEGFLRDVIIIKRNTMEKSHPLSKNRPVPRAHHSFTHRITSITLVHTCWYRYTLPVRRCVVAVTEVQVSFHGTDGYHDGYGTADQQDKIR